MINDKVKNKMRKFYVEYLPLCEKKSDQEKLITIPINIQGAIEKLSLRSPKSLTKEIKGEIICLQTISLIDTNDELFSYNNLKGCEKLWNLRFIKFKNSEVLGIADSDGTYDEEVLDEVLNVNSKEDKPKYVASPTQCLYDGDKNLFVIARNTEGPSIGSILDYLSKILNNTGLMFTFLPNKPILNMNECIECRNIEVSIEDFKFINQKTKKQFEKSAKSVYNAVNSLSEFGMNRINISGTMGTKDKKSTMNKKASEEILALSTMIDSNNNNNIVKLGIGVFQSGKTTHINLLNDKFRNEFSITYTNRDRIKSSKIYSKLLADYNNSYKYISSIYKKGE